MLRLAATLAIVLCFVLLARAGGPEYVAGTSFFNTNMTGRPLTWQQGQLIYFTDQGDLSPILPGPAADALVADAFSRWTSVPTAALAVTNAGQLAEDVNGSNVTRNDDNTLTMPADIQSNATGTPIGIVYDVDGTVTDALLGSGSGDPSQCFFNTSFGGTDGFAASAHFQHALVVINGLCAQQASQLTELEYRLVRTLGTVIGLSWSQLNLNVITGNPHPTADDLAGFPVMHYIDPFSCVPITRCYPNPGQLSMDDAATVSRLYPITPQNQSQFVNKQDLAAMTASIHGSVWFTDRGGNPTQPMQGVNVVARWVDPNTGLPSGRYAVSSVSGFLFTGNAGNPVTGFLTALGDSFSQYGSNDPAVEGFFQLAGLPILNSDGTAQYQLSVEPLDLIWSEGVIPYAPFQVAPSGPLPPPMFVTVTAGDDIAQDILMTGSAQPIPQWATSETWEAPAPIPAGGDWMGSINGYGDVSYFSMPAQANRTMSIAVTALDETGGPSQTKAQPLLGMWSVSDPPGTLPSAFTSSPFNSPSFGLTRLDAQILSGGGFLIGITDLRGDGRPDYHYHAHVLYGDTVSPPRASANGGAVTVHGTGFQPGLTVTVGNGNATPLAINGGQVIVAVPAQGDGPQTLTITDPVTGSFSTMTGALTYGAAADDNIFLVKGSNPLTPVGTQAVNPVSVRVVAADGVTPVAGATLGWSTSNSAMLSACAGSGFCLSFTDDSGVASTLVTPGKTGTATITATLAPGVYTPSKAALATLVGTSTSSDIGVTTPFLWIAQGVTMAVPITARVVGNGVAKGGVGVNFRIAVGSGSLSASSALTDSNGFATVALNLTNFSSVVQVTACVAPSNRPCQTVFANPVAAALLLLQPVAGTAQAITLDHVFQPLIVRVTDSVLPPNPVLGAVVAFQNTVLRPASETSAGGASETVSGSPGLPVILSVTQASVQSDVNGLASVVPSAGTFTGNLEVDVSVAAGAGALLDYVLQALPAPVSGTGITARSPPLSVRVPVPVRGPLRMEMW